MSPSKKKVKKEGAGQRKQAVYRPVMESIFFSGYKEGALEVDFTRAQIDQTAAALGVDPKNVGDLVYYFRYRAQLPDRILAKAPKGKVWIIRGTGDAKYRVVAVDEKYALIKPSAGLAEVRIPDATPGIIEKYRLSDEQALLAVMRYNRLIDVFLGATCYSLQSHLRTRIQSIGQIETDEIYVGVDKHGGHYVVPVQAKGKGDQHSIVQIEQDFALCNQQFPNAICRPVAAQFVDDGKIALFSFRAAANGDAEILAERHYKLVPSEALTEADLKAYRQESLGEK